MEVLKADFRDVSAPKRFCLSLQQTGFAVVSHHPIKKSLIDDVYEEWKNFFNSPEKKKYTFQKSDQAGYFPFGMENAKGSELKDLKEFFHIYEGKVYPLELSRKSLELRNQLYELGSTLLEWIQSESPEEVRESYSCALHEMIKDSEKNLFRIIHYPPLDGTEEEGAIRAAAHEDINLITLLPASTASGLEVMDRNSRWHQVPGDFGDIVVNVGDMLQMASGGFYRSTTHRVVNPKGAAAKTSRYSMPLFLHPRPEVRLSNDHTAETYLDERLREIGLK
jgi:isopenicillin N synthase-like dioxygenase